MSMFPGEAQESSAVSPQLPVPRGEGRWNCTAARELLAARNCSETTGALLTGAVEGAPRPGARGGDGGGERDGGGPRRRPRGAVRGAANHRRVCRRVWSDKTNFCFVELPHQVTLW